MSELDESRLLLESAIADTKKAAWNDAIEAAAEYMLSRKISASQFYATELRKLKK